MNSIIIYQSFHHSNTEKIARFISGELGCEMKKIQQISIEELLNYDLIGIGSGTYFSKFHDSILKFVEKLPDDFNKKVFLFSTHGAPVRNGHGQIKKILKKKGCTIVEEFSCPGHDTWGPWKYIGGLSKGRPNDKDILKARIFSKKLKEKYGHDKLG